ncbi:GNAT family N-acetyltransferase [Rheinheimera texasensis]|uniref:GNAT family N-acetyltransferase n=1 Tax=Rheinheimera texasensis TaxID=306205 RepID=UPI0004E20A7E|nr:GNAT family N-acetyltransferase [Rheinheimera texasensis]
MTHLQTPLTGSTILLRPLQPDDWPALMQAASDPLIWTLHPEPERYKPEIFKPVFDGGLASGGAYLICDKRSGEVLGTSRYYEFDATKREVAIGYTFLVRSRWGGATNTELKQLMLDHAFDFADAVWFHVGEQNLRSRRAVEKLGAVYTHTETTSPTGATRATVFYRLDKAIWLAR